MKNLTTLLALIVLTVSCGHQEPKYSYSEGNQKPETATEPKEIDSTVEPKETVEPETTAEPKETVEPEETAEPVETVEPETTAEPKETVETETTTEPKETVETVEIECFTTFATIETGDYDLSKVETCYNTDTQYYNFHSQKNWSRNLDGVYIQTYNYSTSYQEITIDGVIGRCIKEQIVWYVDLTTGVKTTALDNLFDSNCNKIIAPTTTPI